MKVKAWKLNYKREALGHSVSSVPGTNCSTGTHRPSHGHTIINFPTVLSLNACLGIPIQCTSFINWQDIPLRSGRKYTSLSHRMMDHPISINWSHSSPAPPSLYQCSRHYLRPPPPICRLQDAVRSLPLRTTLAPRIKLAPLDSVFFHVTLHFISVRQSPATTRCCTMPNSHGFIRAGQ
jgi:hypothetical protein